MQIYSLHTAVFIQKSSIYIINNQLTQTGFNFTHVMRVRPSSMLLLSGK